jgi:hypothetical protein
VDPILVPESLGVNPYLPTGYVLSTWWVLKQNTQHGPTRSILITFAICPKFAHPNTHQVHVEYFQKVPSTEPAEGGHDLPTGFILINFTFCPQFAHPNTHWAHVEYFYKVPTQIPADHWVGYIQKVPTKNPVGKSKPPLAGSVLGTF